MDGNFIRFDEDLISFSLHLCDDSVHIVRGKRDVPDGTLRADPGTVAEYLQQAVTGISFDAFGPFPHDRKTEYAQVKILCPGKFLRGAAFHGNMMNACDHDAFSSLSGVDPLPETIIHDAARECKENSERAVFFDAADFI